MTRLGVPDVLGVTGLVQVGRGGFATVYRGYQERFDRSVAVKVLDVDSVDAAALRRFERECAVMGRLSGHAHVVTIYDSGILADRRPFLLTEFCDGGSLADRVARTGPLPVHQIVDVGRKLASALQEAHSNGIVHRDIKPSNVLVRASGEPALADFGLSLRMDRDASRGLDAFSPEHTAPENLAAGECTSAADVYSLGSTLYALVTGAPPFPHRSGEAPMPHISRVLSDPVPPISRPEVPADIGDLLLRMLAKRPSERPSAAEVLERFGALHGSHGATGASPAAPAWQPWPDRPPADTTAARDHGPAGTRPLHGGGLETRLRPSAAGAHPAGAGRWRRSTILAAIGGAVVAALLVLALTVPNPLRSTSSPVPPPPTPQAPPPDASPTAAPGPSAPPAATAGEEAPTSPSAIQSPAGTDPAPPSETAAAVPAGYREVAGPHGLLVAIPNGWQVRPGPGPSNSQADDPGSAARFVRFAGEPAQPGSVLDKVVTLEEETEGASTVTSYSRLQQRRVAYGSADEAVDWEFTFVRNGQLRHAFGRYWRIGGVDYVVYASGPEEEWPLMQPVLAVMIETARPH